MAVEGSRLFATPETAHEVLVFNLRTGKLLHVLRNIDIPHAPVYLKASDQFYVTYGGSGSAAGGLKLFNGQSYALIKNITLFPHADATAYDAALHRIYVDDGAGIPTLPYGRIRVVDSTTFRVIATYKYSGAHLKRMILDSQASRLYVNDVAAHQVDVIDPKSGALVARWPVKLGTLNIPLALDELHHRLFVGCRSGVIVVIDTITGKEKKALPIGKGIDDLIYDPGNGRLYASCGGGGGEIDVYQEEKNGANFRVLGRIASAPGAKTAILSTDFQTYLVAVAAQDGTPARILAYKVQ